MTDSSWSIACKMRFSKPLTNISISHPVTNRFHWNIDIKCTIMTAWRQCIYKFKWSEFKSNDNFSWYNLIPIYTLFACNLNHSAVVSTLPKIITENQDTYQLHTFHHRIFCKKILRFSLKSKIYVRKINRNLRKTLKRKREMLRGF